MGSKNQLWSVYLLECVNGKIYTGISTDIEKRFARHVAGRGAKFTKRNPPSHLLAAKSFKNKSEACKTEWAIKQMKPFQKRLLSQQWSRT